MADKFLTTLLNAYPAFEPKDPQGFVALWTEKFAGYPAQVLERTANRWIDGGNRFFPSLPEIKQLVDQAAAAPVVDEGEMYWTAMDRYNAQLRGELVEDPTLDRRYKRFFLRGEDNPAAWAEAQAVTREWMGAD